LLVKKLNALSPCKYLTELDVVEQLAQHFDRPLTKGKAEAIDVLANHAKQGHEEEEAPVGTREERWLQRPGPGPRGVQPVRLHRAPKILGPKNF